MVMVMNKNTLSSINNGHCLDISEVTFPAKIYLSGYILI